MNPDVALSRRAVVKTLGAGAALLGLGLIPSRASAADAAASTAPQPFALPPLGYAYAALEPHIDAQTIEAIVRDLPGMPEKIRTALRNNVGGHVNHSSFWKLIAPASGPNVPGVALASAITQTFGSLTGCQEKLTDAAMKRFGSGWAWLGMKDGKLVILSTANQDSPLSDGITPVLGLDVWEHAYYLHYQNRRADYVAAFWKVVNWAQADRNYSAALQS